MFNVVLVGMMGSGKSTIAELLSEDLKLKVVDADSEIESQEKMKIKDIFSSLGETHFRELEKNYLKMFNEEGVILSTGGGMVITKENRKRLKEIGHVIYLEGSTETLVDRLFNQTGDRPLLDVNTLREQIVDLLKVRSAYYLESADSVVRIDEKKPEEVCASIYTILREIGYNSLR
jgi:shikimate kinase